MNNTFHHQVECLTRLNQQKITENTIPSISLSWDTPKSTASTDNSLNSNSSNSRKYSPSSAAFQNFDVSSISCPATASSSSTPSYTPKVNFDAFNLGSNDDWMYWEHQNGRTISASPTQTSNTTVTTPPDIQIKPKTPRSPILSSVNLGAITSANFIETDRIMEDSFVDNTICYDGRENLFRHPIPKSPESLVRHKLLVQSHKSDYSFPLTYPQDACLNFIDETPPRTVDRQMSENSAVISAQTSRDIAPPELSYGTHGQQLYYSDLPTQFSGQNNGNDIRNHKSPIEYQTMERSETESNQSEEISLSSTSPPSSLPNLGSHSHNSVNARYVSRKRKSQNNILDKNREPSSESNAKNLSLNENSAGPEEVPTNGIMHSIGRTRTPKKTAHNMIEKRYRTNLNDKIAALRDAVPSLRVAIRSDLGLVQDRNGNNKLCETTENRDDNYSGLPKTGIVDIESEDLQGLTVAPKLNKATILTKAAEYITHLEKRNRALTSEIMALKSRVDALEMMNLSAKVGEGIWMERFIES